MQDIMDSAGFDPSAPATSFHSMQAPEPKKCSITPGDNDADFDAIAAALSLMMMHTADSSKRVLDLNKDNADSPASAPESLPMRVSEPSKKEISMETKDFGAYMTATTARRERPARIPSIFTSHRVATGIDQSPTYSFTDQYVVVNEQPSLAWLHGMSVDAMSGGGDVTDWDDLTPAFLSEPPPLPGQSPALRAQADVPPTYGKSLTLDNATSINKWLNEISTGLTPGPSTPLLPSPKEPPAPYSNQECDSPDLFQFFEMPTMSLRKRKRSASVLSDVPCARRSSWHHPWPSSSILSDHDVPVSNSTVNRHLFLRISFTANAAYNSSPIPVYITIYMRQRAYGRAQRA